MCHLKLSSNTCENKIVQETLSTKDKTLALNELAKSIVSDSRMGSLFDESWFLDPLLPRDILIATSIANLL